ncbi:MAG: hypothetical protein IPM53_15140 [Anaerolineaceae bacterium]|nr:hypothetical protein [Anaerolineaceae bacterium]
MELPKIFSDVIEQVLPLVQAECLSIILRKHNHRTYVAAAGLEAGQLLGQQVPLEEGVPGEGMRTGNVVQVADEDGRFNITNVCPCHLQ